MALEAVIGGLGFTSFLLFYASFNISDERLLEKIPMYFFALATAIAIPVVLYIDSNQGSSTIAFLNGLLSNYVVVAVGFLVAMVLLYSLFVIIKKLNDLNGDKENGKE